jgi:uncharacterized RDD family membrane protein YckC
MKCPKCSYLGFETGDRCKNCGYDFSLIAGAAGPPDPADVELTLLPGGGEAVPAPAWDIELHPRPQAFDVQPVAEPRLPLFSPPTEDDGDEPLIKLPAAPRPPLAVRRTVEPPRLRAVPKAPTRVAPQPEPEPVLEFSDDRAAQEEPVRSASADHASPLSSAGTPGARLGAAAVDHAILLGIDLAVVYLTLRIAGLTMDEWTAVPVVPLVTFLMLVKLAYFCAFTALGGQTIGKMATHLRVVMEDGNRVDGASAARRTAAGIVSALTLGLGFLPALMSTDRRALHDRLSRTRVVPHSA